MESLYWRIRIAVLWIVIAVGMSAHMLLAVFMPGKLEEVMAGRVEDMEITTARLVMSALFWIVPLAMAFLALVLRDPVNRYANMGVGVLITGMWTSDLIANLVANEELSGALSLDIAGMVLAGLAILWHTWKWPKARPEVPSAEG